jgi:hypothetical protein
VNFLRRHALLEKKILDDSSRLDVVEITRVRNMFPSLVSFLVGLRTYQHPGKCFQFFRIASSATVTTDVFIAAVIVSRVKYDLRGLGGNH